MNKHIPYNEQELMLMLIEGDEAAFERIYNLYSHRLLWALTKLVKSQSLAGELLQEVFIRLWNKRGQIDPEKSLRSYLFRIAENIAYDHFRKAARDKIQQQALLKQACGFYEHVEEELYTKENAYILQNLIVSLPPQRSRIFRLVKMEGKSYAEVSELMNISVSTINDHVVKATKFIRRQMSSHPPFVLLPLLFFLLFR